MHRWFQRFAWILACAALIAPLRAQDQVELSDGTKLEGRVVFEDDQELVLLVSATRERSVPRAKVKNVRSLSRSQHEVLDQWDNLQPTDAGGLWQLATLCRDRGLKGESQVFAWMVVQADPQNAPAHELLGHKLRGGAWQVEADNGWISLERLHKLRADFKDSWEFSTLHYRLRTNLPLARALTAAIDLERFYRFFQVALGTELKLHEVIEPMDVAIHTDAKSYPEPSAGRRGYYSPTLNTLFALADRELDTGALYHDATFQLLSCTAEREAKARGNLPAWLSQGLAAYMQSSVSGGDGHATLDLGRAAPNLFAEHANAKKPFDLSRMFSFGVEDFEIDSRVQLKYAQSYSLVHFLLHGQGGKLRPGFFDYLRKAYLGDSSSTAFRDALGQREQDFEKAWHAYARLLASQ